MFKELKNDIEILVSQTVFKLWIKTVKILFWSIIQEPLELGLYLLSPSGLNFNASFEDAYIMFQIGVDIFEEEHKACYFVDRGAVLGRFSHYVGIQVLEPNTYKCPIRTIRTYWAEILIFDQKMGCSAQYVRMAMTLKILQVLIILPRKIYIFTKDNSTHGNFVQGQLDQRQFRPNSIVSVSTRISWNPPVGVTWDTRPKVISPKSNCVRFPFTYT